LAGVASPKAAHLKFQAAHIAANLREDLALQGINVLPQPGNHNAQLLDAALERAQAVLETHGAIGVPNKKLIRTQKDLRVFLRGRSEDLHS
jgi:hypothetical protein